VEVHVQVEGVAESLHEGDGAALRAGHVPLFARSATQGCEDRTHEDCEHGARERGVVGEAVAKGEREREHPLPDGHLREDPIDQVRRRVRHAVASARGTEPAAFAGEGDHAVEAATVAVHAHEAVGEDAAAQERPKLALDEAGHGPLAPVCAGQEGRERSLNDAVEDALLGAAPAVARLAATGFRAVAVRSRRCEAAHPSELLPTSYRAPATSSALGEALPIESAASRSRSSG